MDKILKFLKKKLKEAQQGVVSAVSDDKGFIRRGKPTLEPLRKPIQNIKQNVSFILNPETRSDWARGFTLQSPQPVQRLKTNLGLLANSETRETFLKGFTPSIPKPVETLKANLQILSNPETRKIFFKPITGDLELSEERLRHRRKLYGKEDSLLNIGAIGTSFPLLPRLLENKQIRSKVEEFKPKGVPIGKALVALSDFLGPSKEEREIAQKYFEGKMLTEDEKKRLEQAGLNFVIGASLDMGGLNKLTKNPKVGETVVARFKKTTDEGKKLMKKLGEEIKVKILSKPKKMKTGAVMVQAETEAGKKVWLPISKHLEWFRPLTTPPETAIQPSSGAKERLFFKTAEEARVTPGVIKEELKKSPERFYIPKSNPELLKEASEFLEKHGYDETLRLLRENKIPVEKQIATGELLARKAFSEGRMEDGFKIIEDLSKKGTEMGRGVQSFAIWSRLTPEGMLKYVDKVLKEAEEKYRKSLTGKLFKKLDFKLTTDEKKLIYNLMTKAQSAATPEEQAKYTKQALQIMSDKIPLGISDVIDAYRYNNMLSGPLTHARNFFQNLWNTFVTPPLTMAAEGRPKEAIKYEIGALKNISKALDNFYKSLTDKLPKELSKTELLVKEAQYKKIPRPLRVFSDLMEASDVAFRTIIEGAVEAQGKSPEEARRLAEEYLLRTPMKERGRGVITDLIRTAGDGIEAFGRRFRPIRWFVPFVRTPMNMAAMYVEYSPLGVGNIIGNQQKRAAAAKALLGSLATAIGAKLAAEGKITWSSPTDPEEKQYFYASGRKPYSVYINGKWVPAYYFGPFAFALLLPAAIKHYTQEASDALTEKDWKKFGKALTSIVYFWSQSTPMSGLGGFVRTAQGDVDYSVLRNLGYTAQQLIPYNSMLRWINNFVDNAYRRPKDFLEQFVSGIPFVSSVVIQDYYKEPTGEPATREMVNQFLPYAIGIPKEDSQFYEKLYRERQRERQETRLINTLKKKLEEGEELKPEDIGIVLTKSEKQEITKGTPLEALVERKRLEVLYNKADSLFDIYFRAPNDEMRKKIEQNVKNLGIDFEEGFYNYLTKQDADSRYEYIKASVEEIKDRNKLLETLALFRKRGIATRNYLLSSTLIDRLYEEGIITGSERKFLKAITDLEKDKTGKIKIKTKISGGGRKAKAKISTVKFKVPKVKVSSAPKISTPAIKTGVIKIPVKKKRVSLRAWRSIAPAGVMLKAAEYKPRMIKFKLPAVRERL